MFVASRGFAFRGGPRFAGARRRFVDRFRECTLFLCRASWFSRRLGGRDEIVLVAPKGGAPYPTRSLCEMWELTDAGVETSRAPLKPSFLPTSRQQQARYGHPFSGLLTPKDVQAFVLTTGDGWKLVPSHCRSVLDLYTFTFNDAWK